MQYQKNKGNQNKAESLIYQDGATETSALPAGFGTIRRSLVAILIAMEARWLPGVQRAGPSPPLDE